MEAQLKINIVLDLELDTDEDNENWISAGEEERKLFIENKFREYIEDNMNEILNNAKLI
jgi:hypothetical protein